MRTGTFSLGATKAASGCKVLTLPCSAWRLVWHSLTPVHTGYGNAIKCFHFAMPHIPMYVKTSAGEAKHWKSDLGECPSVFLLGNLHKFPGYGISCLVTLGCVRTPSSRVKAFQYNIIFVIFSEEYEYLLLITFSSYKKQIRLSPWNKISSEDYCCKHSSA